MSKSDKMFEEIFYKKIEDLDDEFVNMDYFELNHIKNFIAYKKFQRYEDMYDEPLISTKNGGWDDMTWIIFDLDRKKVIKRYWSVPTANCFYEPKEIEAINQECKDLGWL